MTKTEVLNELIKHLDNVIINLEEERARLIAKRYEEQQKEGMFIINNSEDIN